MRMASPGTEIERLLHGSDVLRALPADERATLAAASRIERYTSPTLLNAAHEPLLWLRLVLLGHIEIIARRASGQEVALGDIGVGGWATWVGCFSPRPPDHDFYSASKASYLASPTRLVRAAAARHPAIFPLVITDLGVRMRQLMEWAGASVLLGPEQRMAKLLHLMARMHGVSGNSGAVHVTQTRLAQVAGCSRQSANLLLGGLAKRGLIFAHYGRFEIPDVTRLAAFIAEEVDAG